jgi:ribosomal protein S27E
MPIALTCPNCRAPQTVADAAPGETVRCPACQAELPAPTAGPAPAAPRRVLPWVIGLVLAGGAALVAYQFIERSTPTDFTDPDGMFSARFPNVPEHRAVSEAQPLRLLWGEQLYRANASGTEYSISVLDGVNAGDQPHGPASRDTHINEAIVITLTNADGRFLLDRPVAHEGHSAREVVFLHKEDGRLTALRVLAGESRILRLGVTGSGDKDNPGDFLDKSGEFFGGVHVGTAFGSPILEDPPTVSAADLVAAYKADTHAADAQFKDRWLRVTGTVREVAGDRTEFFLDAGDGVVLVQRAPPGRRSARVRADGTTHTTTGKCRGLDASATGVRVLLEDAIVAHPPPPK